jgi:hypothetical protein
MNANQLTKLYDRLTVWERIPLLITAEARRDDDEYRRLFEASALRTWRFSEHLLVEQALHLLALLYVGEQLGAAAGYFFAMWQMDGADPPGTESGCCRPRRAATSSRPTPTPGGNSAPS